LGNSSSIKSLGSHVFYSISPALEGPDLTIDNLTIKESDNPVHGYNVYIKDSKFLDNTGTAVYAQFAGDVKVSNSRFTNNIGDSAIDTDGDVEVLNSTFSKNLSSDDGGAIRAGGSVIVSGSYFELNNSTSEGGLGGAIHASQGVDISGSTFTRNSSLVGGAIFAGYAGDESAVITDSTFERNSADVGGAITAYSVEILNSTFLENEALDPEASGGAIYSNKGYVFFSTFVKNVSEDGHLDFSPANDIFKDQEND
jgi:predicted outer membrane repeat protein